MKIKITKISVSNLSMLVRKMLLMDNSIYLNFDSERIWSDVYTPTKDVVKSNYLPINSVFEFESPITQSIKLSFYSGSKLLECLKYFDAHHLSAEVSCFEDMEDKLIYADKIILQDQKLKIEIACQDISLGFTSMTPDQTIRAFDLSSEEFQFTLAAEDFNKIVSLQTMDKGELLSIYSDEQGVHIKNEGFDIIVDDRVKTKSTPKNIFKSFLSRIDKETYRIHVCSNKLILDSTETNTKLALNLAITE